MKETPELFWPMAYWSWLATGSIILQLASSERGVLVHQTRQRGGTWSTVSLQGRGNLHDEFVMLSNIVLITCERHTWQLLPSLRLFCYFLGISELKMPYIYKFTYKKYRLTFQWSAFPADMWSLSSLCKKNHKATTSPLSRKTKWNTLNNFFFQH